MSLADEFERLATLRDRGVLSEEEFQRAKQVVLSGGPKQYDVEIGRSLNELRRSPRDAYLGGICTGLTKVTGLPVWLWRAAFVVLAVSFGVGIVLYLVLWVLVPPEGDDYLAQG